MTKWTIFVTFTMVGLALSGCTDAETSDSSPSNSTTAAPVQVSSDTGSIAGLVTDDEAKPLAKAEVAVTGAAEAMTISDAEGRFTFNDLTPGSYVLTAARLGYVSVAKRLEVAVGAATEATLILEPLQVDEGPRREYKITDGFIAGPHIYSAGLIVYSVYTFPLNLTRGAEDIVAALAWEANAPTTARYLRIGLTHDGDANATFGKSPLVTRLTEREVDDKDKATVSYSIYFACAGASLTAQCFQENPEAVIPVIVYQQRVKIYTTVFYNEVAPLDYTGLP